MKEKLVGGLLAVLLIPSSGSASMQAEQAQTPESRPPVPQFLEGSVAPGSVSPTVDIKPLPSLSVSPTPLIISQSINPVKTGEYQQPKPEAKTLEKKTQVAVKPNSQTQANNSGTQRVEVEKVGEYKQPANEETDPNVIAKIQAHQWKGKPAATLYVRNIPVLTFIGSQSNIKPPVADNGEVSVAYNLPKKMQSSDPLVRQVLDDPVWRASEIAAKVNHLSRYNIDPNTIFVRWEGLQKPQSESKQEKGRYIIGANGEDLVEINTLTVLPETTNNQAEDALQATNLLRRLLGNAPPVNEIAGKPKPEAQPQPPVIATGFSSVFRVTGWASWYGPGFHGNLSANGEVFNENDLTAAHKELPFGTMVRVTNLDNGRSVVVRINDRGPYVGDRIIDLSAGAARVLGMMDSGVAPIQLDILQPNQ
jgi:rare lipoprotein A